MGKKKKGEKKPNKIWTIYDGGKAKNTACPKCGPGFFLAAHSNRSSCGKCGYTEMKSKEA